MRRRDGTEEPKERVGKGDSASKEQKKGYQLGHSTERHTTRPVQVQSVPSIPTRQSPPQITTNKK